MVILQVKAKRCAWEQEHKFSSKIGGPQTRDAKIPILYDANGKSIDLYGMSRRNRGAHPDHLHIHDAPSDVPIKISPRVVFDTLIAVSE